MLDKINEFARTETFLCKCVCFTNFLLIEREIQQIYAYAVDKQIST